MTLSAARRADLRIACFLSAAALCLFALPALLGKPLKQTPELRVAQVAREMLQSGDFIVPRLGGEIRLIKPPLAYWSAALSAKLLAAGGPLTNEVMARSVQIPSAIFGALSVLLVVFYGALVFGRRAGVLAGLVLSTCVLQTMYAQLGHCDATLAFFCTAAFCCAAWILTHADAGAWVAVALGLALGCGFLSKWFIPLAFLGLPLLAELILRRGLERRALARLGLSLSVAVAVTALWLVPLELRLPGAIRRIVAGVELSVAPLAHVPERRWLYYVEKTLLGFMPWTPVLLGAWLATLVDRKRFFAQLPPVERAHLRFFLLTFGLGFASLYSQSKQEWYYLLPLYAALALPSGFVLVLLDKPAAQAGADPGEPLRVDCERNRAFLVGALRVLASVLAVSITTFPLWIRFFDLSRPEAATSRHYVEQIQLSASVPLGLALPAVIWFVAEHVCRGRVFASMALLGVLFYGAFMTWTCVRAEQIRSDLEIAAQAPLIRAQLDAAGKDAQVYGGGLSEPMLIFYLQRPIRTMRDLSGETQSTAGMAPKRMLVGTPGLLRDWKISHLFPPGMPDLFCCELSREVDWPAILQSRQPKKRRPAEPVDNE